MKEYFKTQIGENKWLLEVYDYSDVASELANQFSSYVKEIIFPIFEQNEELKSRFLPDENGRTQEIFPIIHHFDMITKKYLYRIDESAFASHISELDRIKKLLDDFKPNISEE